MHLFRSAGALVVLCVVVAPVTFGSRPAAAQTAAPMASTAPSPAPSAQVTPTPGQSASPSPSPRPLGLHEASYVQFSLIDQATAGQGQVGPEAAGFVKGSALAPNTPYDTFSSGPEVPGVAGITQLTSTLTYGFKSFDASVTGALAYVTGSITNASYWGESLMPTLNPHAGSQALPYAVTFPTHAGGDDGSGVRTSILSGSLTTADGNLRVRGGWFDLAQTDRFVFAQPALTSINPAIAYAPAETLSNGVASADWWQPDATALPLQGIDAVVKRGDATLELTNAALPTLPGLSARVTIGSLVFDRGEGTRFSAEYLHLATSGITFTTTVPFGTNPQYFTTPQGVLPTSQLSGQQQTLAGLRGAFHILPAAGLDGVVEIGASWYDASPVVMPGTSAPGGYYHVGFTESHGRATASLDLYRIGPRYATAILPYGVPENQWSVAFAWPGQWLKSNYQLIDNSVAGVNRQGYRLRYFLDKGPLETHFEYTDLRQIAPETTVTAEQTGYVDGFFLPQDPTVATFGRQKRFATWIAWHPSFGDLTFDFVDDSEYRPFSASAPLDAVSYTVPQYVFTYSRSFSKNVTCAMGFGRYGIGGTFAEPLGFGQPLFFAGVQMKQTPRSSILVTFRRETFSGITTYPASPLSPNFHDAALIVEQRISL